MPTLSRCRRRAAAASARLVEPDARAGRRRRLARALHAARPRRLAGLLRAGRPLAVLALLAATVAAFAVVPRDMPEQLELIAAHEERGLVVLATIDDIDRVTMPAGELPWSRVEIEVERTLLAPAGSAPETGDALGVYTPGFGAERLSISPAESTLRIGERVLLFLRADAFVRDADAAGWKLDSFAEIYRTQRNRRGETIVLGLGPGAAVETNARLPDVEARVKDAYEVVLQRHADAADR